MAGRPIAVLDTNALVRVALAKSPLIRALRAGLEQGAWLLLTSNDILIELGRVLRYPRIAARHTVSETDIQELEGAILKSYQGIEIISLAQLSSRLGLTPMDEPVTRRTPGNDAGEVAITPVFDETLREFDAP